jgi:hypothetical protein
MNRAMELFRTSSYKAGLKRLKKLGATDAEITVMENMIAIDPTVGAVIPGSGGMRKVRFGYAGTGDRGGGRTIYYVLSEADTVYLIVTYPKVDKEDLTAAELKMFKALVKELTNG